MDNKNNDREESEIKTETIHKKPEHTKFLVQAFIGVVVILFAASQIAIYPDNNNNVWVGLICTILGLFFPHPTPVEAGSDDTMVGYNTGNASSTKTTTHTQRSRPTPIQFTRTLNS